MLHGIRGTLRTGASGRDLPDRDGPWRPVAAHSARWRREATWDRRLAHLQTKAGAVGEIEGEVSIDRTTVRAHQHAAGARTKGAPRRMRRPAAAGSG